MRDALGINYEIIDAIPPGWFTVREARTSLGLSRQNAALLVDKLYKQGKAERRTVRIAGKTWSAFFIYCIKGSAKK